MVNKCSIRRQDTNSSPTEEELMSFAKNDIIPSLTEIYNNDDYYNSNDVLSPTKSRQAVIALLQSLGTKYEITEHKYIAQAVELVLNRKAFAELKAIMPVGAIINFMQSTGTAEEAEAKIFTDKIMDYEENENESENYFLKNAYGAATNAKIHLEYKMKNIILNSFIINREDGTIVSRISDALINIENYKKQLLIEIQNYFKNAGIGSTFTHVKLFGKTSDEIIKTYKSEIAKQLQVGIFRSSELQTLYDNAYNNNVDSKLANSSKLKLEAYGSWLALQHFDNFIKMTLGDTIKINPSSPTRYEYSTKGTNINTTWRKDDNIDLQAEVNKLTQALIETSPMIQFGSIVPIEGSYLQFSDFSHITAKIKDLVYDSQTSIFFINDKQNAVIYNALSDDEKQLVKNKSLRQIISNSRYNPQKYLPLIYKILTFNTGSNYIIDTIGKFNSQDKNIIWSIYKNIYDSNFEGLGENAFHSLYSIQQANPDDKNYFAAVSSVADCIFSVSFVQYVYEDGKIKLRTLRDAAVDKTRREIETIINTKNSNELLTNFDFTNYEIKPIDLEGNTLTDNGVLDGITFKLRLSDKNGNPDYLYIHVRAMGDKVTFSKSSNASDPGLSNDEIRLLDKEPNITKFFDEVLGLNLESNADFRNTFRELVKQEIIKGKSDNVTPYINRLLTLSSKIFFNRYFAQTYLKNIEYKNKKTKIVAKFFKENTPNFNNKFFNMEMIPKKEYDTLLLLSQALGTTRGINSSRQVKDSDNAMLSSQTLSRLLGNMVQQLDIQIGGYQKLNELRKQLSVKIQELQSTRNENRMIVLNAEIEKLRQDISDLKDSFQLLDTYLDPAALNFDIIQNSDLFKGMLKSEEIKGLYGNKKQIKFTTAEAVISSFLYNFVLGHCTEGLEANSELGNGVVGLLPSVNSDKTTVSIAKFDLKAKVKGSDRNYLNLTNPEIQNVIMEEFRTFYNTMYKNVLMDFSKLEEYARKKGVIINPENNFRELNEHVDIKRQQGENVTANQIIFDIVNEYNSDHPTNPIRLIDQIHYMATKDGHVQQNNTIQSLIKRFSNPESTREFFNLKSTEVLKSALESGFNIMLYGNSDLDSRPEINYLRENHTNWINNSGQMIIARINYNGIIYDITNKNDLIQVERALGVKNLLNNIHLLKDYITLHPMLEKYNLMDYLFTQQIICSTVGSHVAHPAKSKNKTAIIWAHPAIGKTYSIEQGKYKDKIVDWDVEFNRKRDAWIANQTGFQIGSPEFKSARNEYLINWKNHKDFIQFVESEWKRVKALANAENKILVASPHMLLTLFSEDFNKVLTMEQEDFVKRNVARNANDEENSIKWKQGIDATINVLSSNPVFASRVQIIKPGEYLETLLSNGSFNKELNQLLDNEMAEEASRFYAQHKRNVSFTAAMDQFQLNQIDGIPTWYNIAIIDDIKEDLFTIDGQTDNAKPFDGATFVNPFIVYLENNSLNEARAGIDKKQFVHYYDELTGSGGIIKTAGFGLTNDRMRNSIFYRNMMKNMTNNVWKDASGEDYVADITKNYKGESIDYGTFYFKKGKKYYKATITKNEQPNTYVRTIIEVKQDGSEIGTAESEIWTVNTNYQLWQMFGGMRSQEFNGGKLQPSETSIQNVVKAIINVGEIKNNYTKGDITAEHIDQPLKNADIHYMPTVGAVKQGAANINPNSHYNKDSKLNFFKIRMTNAGIQLDKEHHADSSELSLMTQVISAACSMGYTSETATRLYKALYNLTRQGIKDFRESFKKLLRQPDSVDFEKVIADCMIKKMLTSTAQDGDMLRAIAEELIQKVREGKELTAEDARSFPYSDPAVFEALVSNLSVIMTKSGIKAKMNGILSVLCPTQNIVKMYNFVDQAGIRHNLTLSQLEEMYGDDYENIIDKIQNDQKELDVTSEFDTTQIEIGNKYKITLDGIKLVVDVKFPHTYPKPKPGESLTLKNGQVIGYNTLKQLIQVGRITKIQEYIKDGKELGSINYKFKGNNGKSYQIWDIDYIQDLFETMRLSKDLDEEAQLELYQNLIIKYEGSLDKFIDAKSKYFELYQNKGAVSLKHQLKLAKLYAKQIQQKILFSLSKNNSDKIDPVLIDGQPISIIKDSIVVDAYELVMPKTFLNEFGLGTYANLDEIRNNPDYFYDRMVRNFGTKVFDETHYDLELKKVNGKHIYLKDRAGLQPRWDEDLEKLTIYKKTEDDGTVWRIDLSTNKKMYQLYSESDEVYRIPGTDTEIILTSSVVKEGKDKKQYLESGLTFYLNNFKYQSLHVSEAIADGKRGLKHPNARPQFNDILLSVSKSKNKTAKSWMKLFNGDGTTEIEQDKQGWLKDRVEFNKELNNFEKLGSKLRDHLLEQSKLMHTSLLKSLDIIAARIPAQNQQSFMPMKVVAWDNPNINTAYVSVMQFFLQGSDLDIDAVSLLTFSFSGSGEFYDWSPDFNMKNIDMLNISMNIPFPTGEELQIVDYNDPYVNLADRKPLLTENIHYQNLINADQNVLTEEQEKYLLKEYIALLKDIEKAKGIVYFDGKESIQQAQSIIDRINKHNTYLVGVSDKIAEGAIKNYIVGSLHSISTDSANLLEAHTGVDVATGPIKDIANKSALSEVLKTATPGNVFNKFQAIEEASVGKDDIAICATGLKGFFASSQFCNEFLNSNIQSEDITEEQMRSITSIIKFNPVEIGGKIFNTLANIRVDDLEKITQEFQNGTRNELYDLLLDKGFDEDASIIMSALLSLSTDNAKELCLAKINAGTNMMGMYLYGAAIGMDFEVLNQIIASPIGFTISKLLNSNEFNLTQGKSSINAALQYLNDGPKPTDLYKFKATITKSKTTFSTIKLFENAIKTVLSEDPQLLNIFQSISGNDKIIDSISIKNISKLLAKLARQDQEIAYVFLNKIRAKVNQTIPAETETDVKKINKFKNFKAINNQLYDFLEEFIGQASSLANTKYVTEYGESDILIDLNKLVLGADEFKRLGQLLRLNQEIKTKSDELINFVQKFETIIVERAKLIRSVNKRLEIKSPDGITKLETFDFKEFAESFINNPDNPEAYHNKQIAFYEQFCKTCINPLRVLTSVDHYKGYLESMIYAYEGDYTQSIKFRAIKHLGNTFIDSAKVVKASDRKAVYKGVQSFVDDYINNAYLKEQSLLQLPKSSEENPTYIIDMYGKLQENNNENTHIQLGTSLGNETFEQFFENTFIPALKRAHSNNIFVRDLTSVLITDSVSGVRHLAVSLPINMMPSSENEQLLFNKYKNDFNKIAGQLIQIGNVSYSIIEMFHYYNLLKFRGKGGRSSLLKIFEDTMNDPRLKSYRTFVNIFDRNYDFKIGGLTELNPKTGKTEIGIDPETLYKYIAPLSSPFSSSAQIIKYKDSNTGQIVLLQKKEEEKQQSANNMSDEELEEMTDFDEIEGVFGEEQDDNDDFVEEMMDEDNLDIDEDMEITEKPYKPNYGNYEPYGGTGILTRFEPQTIQITLSTSQIIPYLSTNEGNVDNIIIVDGKFKQFEYNGKKYDIDSDIPAIILYQEQGQPDTYLVNKDNLESIIKVLNCE